MKSLIDLHTHTIVSGHAFSTLHENIQAASEKGLKFLGTSEHGPTMPNGAHEWYFSNLRVVPRNIKGVEILRGAEANIINSQGELDLTIIEMDALDYMIASLHPPCFPYDTRENNTMAILNAMKNPKVKVIGHPDESCYPLDYEKLVEGAKKYDVLLEVNNSSLDPDGFRIGAIDNLTIMLKECMKKNVKIILGSDAHIHYDIGNFLRCEALLEKLSFPDELVVNYSEKEIRKYFYE
jgi:putative hydrolase